jgi:hypothetical protein
MDDPATPNAKALPALEDIFQPWELVGRSRRDCDPHRGDMLRRMARFSLLAAGLSFFGLPFNLVGLPLGLITWSMACRDRDRICAGDMDQAGYHLTEKARSDSRAAVFLNILVLPMTFCGAGLILYLIAMLF